MSETTHPDASDGRLIDNVVHFTRALRKAGVKVGTAQVQTAIEAVEAAGMARRDDVFHALRAALITRSSDLELFAQVFDLFWRDPGFLDAMMHMLSPELRDDAPPAKAQAAERRAREALQIKRSEPAQRPRQEIMQDAAFSWSENAVLRRKDFEQMTSDELAEAGRAISRLRLQIPPLPGRRPRPNPAAGAADPAAAVRQAMRRGGEILEIPRRTPRPRPPDLVALCDVSGSMSVYSRMMIRFLHALTHARSKDWGKVHGFTFGTELSNISRALSRRDPDIALTGVGQHVTDWEGGTRIGPSLERFNKDWSRRVLGRGAVVLLITDGLERGDLDLLDAQARRLALSARRFLWLNPLLRFDGFEPLAGGARTLLPHVDGYFACHSLDSLADLSRVFDAGRIG